MSTHPIYLSQTIYQLLLKRAEQEQTSLEQVVERLLGQSLIDLPLVREEIDPESQTVNQALAAVQRLTTLFIDIETNWLEQAIDDPMLHLANVDLDLALV